MSIKRLRELEKEYTYLFHGTPEEIEGCFKPRQAYTLKNGEKIKDGDPAIYATPSLDLAIFMATVTPKNAPRNFHSRFNRDKEGINLLMNKDTSEQIKPDSIGYVYVFKKGDFKERSPIEFFSNKIVDYIDVGKVKFDDLVSKVKIFE